MSEAPRYSATYPMVLLAEGAPDMRGNTWVSAVDHNEEIARLRGLLKEAAGAAIYYRDQLRLYEGNRFEGHAIHDAVLAKLAKDGL